MNVSTATDVTHQAEGDVPNTAPFNLDEWFPAKASSHVEGQINPEAPETETIESQHDTCQLTLPTLLPDDELSIEEVSLQQISEPVLDLDSSESLGQESQDVLQQRAELEFFQAMLEKIPSPPSISDRMNPANNLNPSQSGRYLEQPDYVSISLKQHISQAMNKDQDIVSSLTHTLSDVVKTESGKEGDKVLTVEPSLTGQAKEMSTTQPSSLLAGELTEQDISMDKISPALKSQDESSTIQTLNMATTEQAKVSEPVQNSLNNFFTKMDFSSLVKPGSAPALQSTQSGSTLSNPQTEITDFSQVSQSLKANYQIGDFTARIKIYPPELGEVQAKISMQNGQATLSMTADDASVKQLIESNLAKLKESFSDANLNLTQVDVSDKQDAQKRPSAQQGNKSAMALEQDEEVVAETANQSVEVTNRSLVDIYA